MTRDRADHCRRIGSLGGRATVDKYGREHMAAIGRIGFQRALEEIGGRALATILQASYQQKYGHPPLHTTEKPKQRRRQKLRRQARDRHGKQPCQVCGRPAELHHLDIRHRPEEVVPLCRTHHLQAEHPSSTPSPPPSSTPSTPA